LDLEAVELLDRGDTPSPQRDVEVEVLGKRYFFKSIYDARTVQQVASMINEMAAGLQDHVGVHSSPGLPILTLMQMGFELRVLKKEYRALRDKFEHESERLLLLVGDQ